MGGDELRVGGECAAMPQDRDLSDEVKVTGPHVRRGGGTEVSRRRT
jgi:hypothetical protein